MGELLATAWFLPFVLPICFYVAWTDLARMKITNVAVGALLVVFAVVGAMVLPLPDYLWRWAHFALVLVVALALYAGGLFGGGDAKFLAAAAPYVALADLSSMLILLSGFMLAAYAAHRLARASALRRLAPGWESWTSGRRFPMGLPFGGALATYLVVTSFA
ncbi:hypothetical protein OG2516_07592 [Oceanicola granulosus HTCC2516]|uniref:Prepilin type IV endopeptidase peptidase domain-containing protein n=1 Tax=Oceanicola granulosus (strain ATCC BAA-861 / DSM 15982 / KCTC 12143 / HTCC2516) TaxID=314256 RepID=Q2CID6_OCEGH|nr:prepilin peptidase [Oceanicola granulosus]EAR52322.1 hypothetical protein OG2516_07592 [Oceanicola granulosus HTCC2516]